MHLIQGSIDTSTVLLTSTLGAIAIGVACGGVRRQISGKQMPALLGMTGLVFLAQMLNFSTGMGFSCHLIGASLLAMMFGPFAAMLSMASILTLQLCFLSDGSWHTLGANFLSMGVAAPWVAYALLRWTRGRSQGEPNPRALAGPAGPALAALAAFGSVMAASLSIYLMVESPLWGMVSMAIVWGLMEAAIATLACILLVPRETRSYTSVESSSRIALRPLILIACVALCLLPYSSQVPDGLEYQLARLATETK